MASRILVVHYSRTGHTKQLAQQIAGALGADLEAISDRTHRSGAIGFLRSAYEAIRGRQPDIAPPAHDPAAYAMVVIGTPIWSGSMASPIRSYLARHRDALHAVAFFCTCGGSGGERAFDRMSRACGLPPASTLIVREAELARSTSAVKLEVDRFVAEARMAAEPEPRAARAEPLPPPPG
jgi:flavodoxin